jgi:hypothetical protein
MGNAASAASKASNGNDSNTTGINTIGGARGHRVARPPSLFGNSATGNASVLTGFVEQAAQSFNAGEPVGQTIAELREAVNQMRNEKEDVEGEGGWITPPVHICDPSSYSFS